MHFMVFLWCFFFFKQKTAYEMRISDWSSDVCSSDLVVVIALRDVLAAKAPVDAVIGAEQVEDGSDMGGTAIGELERLHRQVTQQHLVVRGGDEIMRRGRAEIRESHRLN